MTHQIKTIAVSLLGGRLITVGVAAVVAAVVCLIEGQWSYLVPGYVVGEAIGLIPVSAQVLRLGLIPLCVHLIASAVWSVRFWTLSLWL